MRALSPHPAAWGALGLLLLLSFGIDFVNVRAGGAIDLRNRVTGSRLLVDHVDPYFYKWAEPAAPEYCDPHNNPHLPVSKTTATPAFLVLNIPLAALPYRLGEFAWLFLQWLCLLGTGWLWLRHFDSGWKQWLLTAFLTGLTYTNAWRLHAERGQSYVLLLFLFAAWLASSLRADSQRPFVAGMLAGVLTALRPPFLLIMPFLLIHRRKQLPGAAVGLLLALALPMLWRGDCWMKYGSAMEENSSIYRSGPEPRPGAESFPPVIEGMPTDLLASFAPIPYADFSVHALLNSWGLEPFPAWPPLLLAGALFAAWLWWSHGQATERLLLGVAVWYFLIDLFLPAYRNVYNDVLIVNILALGLVCSARAQPAFGVWSLFLALPVGWAISYFVIDQNWILVTPSLLFSLGAASLLFWFKFGVEPGKVKPAERKGSIARRS